MPAAGMVLAIDLWPSVDRAYAEAASFAVTPEQLRPRSTAHSEPPSLTELSHQALPLAICVFIFGSWCMCVSNSPFSYQYTEQCTEISLAAYDSSQFLPSARIMFGPSILSMSLRMTMQNSNQCCCPKISMLPTLILAFVQKKFIYIYMS